VGLRAHPNSYRLVFERGVLYAMEDQFDRAEQDFRQSARLAPATNFGYVGIGVTYLETGNAGKAIDLLHERLKKEPNDASLLYLLGEALMRNGAQPGQPQYREAQSSFEQAVHLNPSLCLPHVALGEIYIDEERFKDAVDQLQQARAIDPKEKSAYSHLAVAYRRLGDPDSAKRTLGMLKDIHDQEQGWVRNRMKSGDDGPSQSRPN
jgi:Flp pilus assembly protein TadD